ncbi:hypothetical protein CPB83DRAFT_756005 [Crepidotus variabilis]|uniref:SET domain-containing protein n=1 Tax=Crepidotus variabilis TaxID=179855 RepID=A0A9P6ES20_9AGAR|nr:hypothetical protein CPB83DRAFT_756005 [Crepidotus variabilis]
MSESNRSSSSTYITAAAVSVAVGLAAYAVYFDYKRRNDVEFRKKLKKEKKRLEKTMAASEKNEPTPAFTPAELREVLTQLKQEAPPASPEEKEGYFMSQVGLGEQLAAQGPAFHLPAAMAFYRALRVYPSPVELIVIYQKTIPEAVFKIVMDLTNLDVSIAAEEQEPTLAGRIDEEEVEPPASPLQGPPSETSSSQEWDKITDPSGYYDYFPPKKMNVSIVTREGPTMRQVLVLSKDVAAGEVIYKEHPVVTALDPDLQALGTYCAHCLRPIDPEMSLSLTDESHTFPQTYCSKSCMLSSKSQSHTLLFTLENPLPAELAAQSAAMGGLPSTVLEARQEAQEKFAEFVKARGKTIPLLVAKFIARQVAIETQKLANSNALGSSALGGPSPAKKTASTEGDFTDADGTSDGYTLSDHIERLRYLEIDRDEEEEKLLIEVLRLALPGLEEFMTAQKHAIVSGKMAYNAFGVCYGGGRDDRPDPTTRPEDTERTRTPYGTSRQIGTAFYTLSSYLTHSCVPSARPSFVSGTSEVSIIANRDLKAGDELTIAFVDVTPNEKVTVTEDGELVTNIETTAECRRRRRYELARGWRFACQCERCKEEAEGLTLEEKGGASAEEEKDESKIEEVAKKAVQIGKDVPPAGEVE